MGRSARMVMAMVAIVVGLVLAGVGVFFVVAGLEDADRWASVFSMFLTALGLAVSVYGVVLTRSGLARQGPAAGQRVGGDVRGPNLQVGRAADVRAGSVTPRPRRTVRRARQRGQAPPGGGQEVGGSVDGRNVQIGEADDVDVE
jgi:hypothetical protein